jgi:AcrR family transcriptional regulator
MPMSAASRPGRVDQAPPDPAVKLGRGRRPQARKLRDAKDALYREHIMEVAETIFAEQGYAKAKMQDIAAAAGVSLATLYQSYPGKQELYRGLLVARDQQMLEMVLKRSQLGAQVPESVEQVLWIQEGHLHFLLQHPDYLRMQLQEGHAWYHRAAQPTQVEQQMWDRGQALLQTVFSWGIRQGWFCPGNVLHLARLLMAMQQTRFANWVMDGMDEAHESVVRGIQADFVRQFCRPEVVARLMTADGAFLNKRTLESIRALGGGTE